MRPSTRPAHRPGRLVVEHLQPHRGLRARAGGSSPEGRSPRVSRGSDELSAKPYHQVPAMCWWLRIHDPACVSAIEMGTPARTFVGSGVPGRQTAAKASSSSAGSAHGAQSSARWSVRRCWSIHAAPSGATKTPHGRRGAEARGGRDRCAAPCAVRIAILLLAFAMDARLGARYSARFSASARVRGAARRAVRAWWASFRQRRVRSLRVVARRRRTDI